ncbi:transmembrane and coiled-coil 2 domain protein [Ceratobasidium sp. AG-Ba]|nr:transmembrane and coiled-coil 2 domain protein [Ceratobasidium sp. AG-Ba]
MSRRTNRLLFCLFSLTLHTPAISLQNSSLHDPTTSPGSPSTQHDPLPTPTTPIGKSKCSRNDPFRIFAPPSDPVCCLIPLPTTTQSDPHPTDDLLSFEEWKQRQLALTSDEQRQSEGNGASTVTTDEDASTPEAPDGTLVPIIDTSNASSIRPRPIVDIVTSLQDRFNYASLDCSARVHGTQKSMKSSNSILSSKKDKYMLAPCSAKNKYVVVELCEEIRVDTVQLANFEFFSGVFKDITITLSQTAHIDGPTSEIMGVYEAKNVRTIQTFHPFKRPHGFYRFIRIEFHTHYGKEYFCPVSLLRVYGLTQMEEWRLEESEREWQARNHPAGLTISSEPVMASSLPEAPVEDLGEDAVKETEPAQTSSLESPQQTVQVTDATALSNPSPDPTDGLGASKDTNRPGTNHLTASTGSVAGDADTPTSSNSAALPNNTRYSVSSLSNLTETYRTSTTDAHAKTNNAKSSRTKVSPSASTVPLVARATHPAQPLPSTSGGESIYRTIMNRLDVLERNSTLSLRYVEEQNYSVRQVLRRLEEEVGRLRALTGQQQQELQRSMRNVEKKQAEMEKRWDALVEQVNTLAEEVRLRVVLEKRLGIAQLCLLTTVLVFMALTRGSRAETHFLGGVRRRADSGLGLARALHPRNRAQSRPRTSERPLAWARQDRPSTGDISHHDPGEPPLTPVRSRSPFPSTGTPSGVRGRKVSGTEASSPTGHSSRGVRFPQGLYPFPLSRPASSLGIMRRRHSLSLSTDQLVPAPGTGKRPATGMKRLARTAHLHEVEIEAQRRRRVQGESAARNNDSGDQKSQTVVYALALSMGHKASHSDGHLSTSNSIHRDSSPAPQHSIDSDTTNLVELSRSEQDNGAEWEDTDSDVDDPGHGLSGES